MSKYLNHLVAGVVVIFCISPLTVNAETLNDAPLDADPPTAQVLATTPDHPPEASSQAYTVSQISTGGDVVSRIFDYYKLEWGKG